MALSAEPIVIRISSTEIENASLTQQNLEIATRALHRDGLVVIEDLIPHEILDSLNDYMIKDAYELRSRKDSPFNYHRGNIQQDPLLTTELFSDEVYVNPIITQITSTTLGPKPSLRFISGNTALPPSPDAPPKSQPTHTDADFNHPEIPFALVINVPLVTMTPENGSTEVWLGTHANTTIADQEGAHGDRASGRIKSNLLRDRRAQRPPCQPVVKKGSVVVRDLRLWHGGMPNMSKDPRVMLAFIHFAPWYRNQMQVEFAEELRERLTLERTGLHVAAIYVSSQELAQNYLSRPYGNAYDFDQTEKLVI
ncbi:hypothetical protein BU24DRAFT_414556 [Aaosphaeria arxii CBS 175.79]|uniref:Phytanoyl-CoA dioxygenase family protein n=1 Tax=Aaosphaeria arxii CBS 175.79 TaxID=1450172 RepID=A0A6A5XB28_9PLEO|nr:uncharacterized protein BU24DRAFT_414556 [Aaosphaeria arxii CBS 175.79]KAF2010120.1 hypothetical protein BU24DRAFT_414556 [Aaosphaeria arxii CBS 175.79]